MKKRIFAVLLASVVAVAVMGCSSNKSDNTQTTSETQGETGSQLSGGWQINTDETKCPLTDDVQKAFDKATEQLEGVTYTPVAYFGSQVVSGTNHMILCKATTVTPNAEPSYKVLVIYQPLEGDAEVTKITDFNYYEYYGENISVTNKMATGGWEVASSGNAINLPMDVQTAFDQALNGFTGAIYVPIYFLGSQVVAGSNYAILCREMTSTDNPEAKLAIVYVYAAPQGNAQLSSIAEIDLYKYV